METLAKSKTRGFDIDSIYVEELQGGGYRWTIFELLKAETIPPERSHPKYYWDKNARKFLSLWALVQSLIEGGFEARLILVNYTDSTKNVKLIAVKSMDESGITDEQSSVMTFSQWREWFASFNNNKLGKTWDVLEYIYERRSFRIGSLGGQLS